MGQDHPTTLSPIDPVIVVARSQLRGLIAEAVSAALVDAVGELSVQQSDEWWDNRRLLSELGISKTTAARWRSKGLVFHKVDGVVLYRRRDVDSFIESHRVG